MEVEQTQQLGGDTQQQPAAFDPKELQTAIVSAIRESQPTPEQKAPTQAELDAELRVWNPDKEFVQEFRNSLMQEDVEDDARVGAFTKLRDGMMTQAQRYAELQVQKQMNNLLPQLAPMIQHFQKVQQEEAEKGFYGEYPTLKDFPEVVQAVASQLSTQKVQVDSPAAARKLLAERVEAVVKKLRPDFSLGTSNSTSTQTNNGAMPRMATLSNGASGGGKPASGNASIWD